MVVLAQQPPGAHAHRPRSHAHILNIYRNATRFKAHAHKSQTAKIAKFPGERCERSPLARASARPARRPMAHMERAGRRSRAAPSARRRRRHSRRDCALRAPPGEPAGRLCAAGGSPAEDRYGAGARCARPRASLRAALVGEAKPATQKTRSRASSRHGNAVAGVSSSRRRVGRLLARTLEAGDPPRRRRPRAIASRRLSACDPKRRCALRTHEGSSHACSTLTPGGARMLHLVRRSGLGRPPLTFGHSLTGARGVTSM
jgi:hypothetical protein